MTPPVPRRAHAYVAAVSAVGVAALVVVLALSALERPGGAGPGVCLALAALTVLGELRPVTVARDDDADEITVSTAASLALVLVGPLWLALVVQCAAVALVDLRSGKSAVRAAFNVGQYALTLLCAAAVHAGLTGTRVLSGEELALPGHLPAALAAGVAYFAVNAALTGVALSLWSGGGLRDGVSGDLPFQLATSGVLLSLAPVVAVAATESLWLLPLLVMPVLAIHRTAQLVAERERRALHDDVTGLPNRVLVRLRAGQEIAAVRPCAVVSLDLDHFKDINDTLGHAVGDDLLRAVGDRLRTALRTSDTRARVGGDEFVVRAAVPDAEGALALGERLLAALHEPFLVGDLRLGVGCSAGVAVFPQHAGDAERLLQRADIALDAAKASRGEARLYDPDSDARTPERLTLAAEVREALDRGELFLQHQPQVDVVSGRVLGFEALVRWRSPSRGLVMPDAFLPVVERTGLIGPLTLTVLDLALTAVARWRAAGHDVTVAVNLSVRNLVADLPAQVARALDRHGLPACALVLEVTETMVMDDPGRAEEVLARLHGLGVAIAVDDFGTGASSLAYLQRLAVDELKVDRSFVSGISTRPGDAVIVRSTVEMGRRLGLRLVAEGVEDEATLELLRDWGCGVAQGWLFSRAMDEAAVLPWLAARGQVGALVR